MLAAQTGEVFGFQERLLNIGVCKKPDDTVRPSSHVIVVCQRLSRMHHIPYIYPL
jgi:hypothetical protein